ncbi:MAG: hypothetical protein QXP36_05220 [Conexivisphaerales archaeon]
MIERFDELELDIYCLLLQNGEMRFSEIFRQLYDSKYSKKYADENSFRVTLVRKLSKMNLKKRDLGHKKVFYSIPEQKREHFLKIISRWRKYEDYIIETVVLKKEDFEILKELVTLMKEGKVEFKK